MSDRQLVLVVAVMYAVFFAAYIAVPVRFWLVQHAVGVSVTMTLFAHIIWGLDVTYWLAPLAVAVIAMMTAIVFLGPQPEEEAAEFAGEEVPLASPAELN